MTKAVVKGSWVECYGIHLFLNADLTVSKRGQGEYEVEGQGSSLPDPLLFQKKVDPLPLRQSPGLVVENGASAISFVSNNDFTIIIYHFLVEPKGERWTIEVKVAGKLVRHPHKREFEANLERCTVKVKKSAINRRGGQKQVYYSPTLLNKKLERLTDIRDSIQKEIEPYGV